MFVVVRDDYGAKRAVNLMTADAIIQAGSSVAAYWKNAEVGEDVQETI